MLWWTLIVKIKHYYVWTSCSLTQLFITVALITAAAGWYQWFWWTWTLCVVPILHTHPWSPIYFKLRFFFFLYPVPNLSAIFCFYFTVAFHSYHSWRFAIEKNLIFYLYLSTGHGALHLQILWRLQKGRYFLLIQWELEPGNMHWFKLGRISHNCAFKYIHLCATVSLFPSILDNLEWSSS